MILKLYLSEDAKRASFIKSEPLRDDLVQVDVNALDLQPYARELLFDTFGWEGARISPAVLRVYRVPQRDWDFHLLAHAYRAACARRRWRQRLSYGAWLSMGILLIVLLNSSLLGVTGLALFTFTLYMVIGIFGMMLA